MKKHPRCSAVVNGFGYLAALLLIFFAYSKMSAWWVDIGGLDTDPFDYQIFTLELPLLVIISSVFFCRRAKGVIFKFILPFFPLLSFYIFFDIFYSFLRRSPHPSDLYNINTVMDFSPLAGYSVILFFIVLLPLVSFFMHAKIADEYSLKTFSFSVLKRILILVFIFSIFYFSPVRVFLVEKFNYIDWSQERTIKSNGRVASFIYYGLQEKKNRETLEEFSMKIESKSINIHNILYPDFLNVETYFLRNIHLVVLESFLDPRLLKNVKFNISPLSPELKPFLLENEIFSLVKSPVYGGRTAQAEFELLTGIPALAKVDSVDFNVMMGNRASSFVQRLKNLGYQAVATIASSSCYFNAKQAYRSIGFNDVTFLKEIDEFDSVKEYLPIFDGDVFAYNLKKVKKFKEEKKGMLFNYVITQVVT